MHRTQLILDDWQYHALRAAAEQRGCSLSALVREILTQHLRGGEASARALLRSIEGVAEGPADLGRDHDRYLYGSGRDPAPRGGQ